MKWARAFFSPPNKDGFIYIFIFLLKDMAFFILYDSETPCLRYYIGNATVIFFQQSVKELYWCSMHFWKNRIYYFRLQLKDLYKTVCHIFYNYGVMGSPCIEKCCGKYLILLYLNDLWFYKYNIRWFCEICATKFILLFLTVY